MKSDTLKVNSFGLSLFTKDKNGVRTPHMFVKNRTWQHIQHTDGTIWETMTMEQMIDFLKKVELVREREP